MKSRTNPGEFLFQIVVADYSLRGNGHRHTVVPNSLNKEQREQGITRGLDSHVHKSKIEVDYIPKRTLFRWAKNGKRAIRKVSRRFGTILSCQKVDSHHRHLNKIESLNLEPVKIEFDMTVEEFTMNRDGIVSRAIEVEGKEIEIE